MSAARDVLASLRLEDERRWIDAAAEFQLADALAVLEGPRPYHFLTRSRGASKTTDLAAVALALLLATDDARRLYWLGADSDQGTLALDSIAGFVSRTPSLAGRVELQSRRVLAPGSGASLDVLAADAAGAWGLRPYAVFADELAQWADTPGAATLVGGRQLGGREARGLAARRPDDGGRPRALQREGARTRAGLAAVARP